jgi:hypothetical protein
VTAEEEPSSLLFLAEEEASSMPPPPPPNAPDAPSSPPVALKAPSPSSNTVGGLTAVKTPTEATVVETVAVTTAGPGGNSPARATYMRKNKNSTRELCLPSEPHGSKNKGTWITRATCIGNDAIRVPISPGTHPRMALAEVQAARTPHAERCLYDDGSAQK